MSRKIRLMSWTIALLGLWEFGDIAAPFTPGFGTVPAFVWNHIGAGLILMIAGTWGAMTRNAGTARTTAALAAVAGLWLIVATFILRKPEPAAGLWNDLAVGVIVVILSSASWLLLKRRA